MPKQEKQTTMNDLVEDPETILALEPEELASVLLQDLIASENARDTGSLNRNNYSNRFRSVRSDVQKAIMEAWLWLEREGCIAPKPMTQGDWIFVTRQGKRLAESQDTAMYKRASLFPKQFLHPVIAQKVWSSFIRGEYDTAVFQAFKQVEVSVRNAGSFNANDFGVSLMRKAFNPDNGPLTDENSVPAERQALSDLFAGAIGSYKNPHSHRNVTVNDPDEAAEMIILASHLMKIIDTLAPNPSEDEE